MDDIMKNEYLSESGLVKIEIKNHGSEAYMTLFKREHLIDETEIEQLLQEAGINNSQLSENLKFIPKEYDLPFLIAEGEAPVIPQVEFQLLFDESKCIDSENFKDEFSKLQDCECVARGEALAHIYITRFSKNGVDIWGNEIVTESKDEDLISQYVGQGVTYSEDDHQLIADDDGYPYIDADGKVNVYSDFVIHSDLDLKYDNFSMNGNLTVNGNIKEKIVIELTGKLTVFGDINDAHIQCERKVDVKGDILNCRSGGVYSSESIAFQSADHSNIYSAGNIYFTDKVNFCKLVAEKTVTGDPETGCIIGGVVQAGDNIEAAVIGNSTATGTEVEITISPFIKERMMLLSKKLAELKESHTDNKDKIVKVEKLIQDYEEKLEESINKALLSSDEAPKHIVAFKKIFPGTYLRILKKSVNITEPNEKVSYSIVDGELIFDNYMSD